jgi:hypothetical protein
MFFINGHSTNLHTNDFNIKMEFPQRSRSHSNFTYTDWNYVIYFLVFSEMEKLGNSVEKHSVKCPGEEGRMIEAHKPLFKLLLEGACSKGKTNFI